MPRSPRILVADGLYHVFTRGNRRQLVYLDAADRFRFLDRLEEVVVGFSWLVHAYCLMPNHYHLLVQTPEPNLSRGMHRLNGLVAQAFNRRHEVDGHLFQGRFKSPLVESDAQLVELARYVVLNPVRARLCTDPAEWRWSSYRATAGLEPKPPLLTLDLVLGYFGPDRETAQRAYGAFVRAALERHAPAA
jgi:REP element-mobilizing transposase RayT